MYLEIIDSVASIFFLDVLVANKISNIKKINESIKHNMQRINAKEIKLSNKI